MRRLEQGRRARFRRTVVVGRITGMNADKGVLKLNPKSGDYANDEAAHMLEASEWDHMRMNECVYLNTRSWLGLSANGFSQV